MITVSYNAYCAISKEGDNDIWTVRPRGVVPLLPLRCRATVNALLGDTFSHENNTHGSRFHDRDPQFASRILGAMTQSCYIGTRDIRSHVIRGPYCTSPLWLVCYSAISPLIFSWMLDVEYRFEQYPGPVSGSASPWVICTSILPFSMQQ